MNMKTFALTVVTIFSIIFVVHGARIVYGWEAIIGGWLVPMWISWLAVVIAVSMIYSGWKMRK